MNVEEVEGLVWTRELGDDLPALARVTKLKHRRPSYRWRCTGCGTTRRFFQREGAFEQAWTHAVEYPCKEVEAKYGNTKEVQP